MKKISIAFLVAVSLASFGCKKKGGADAVARMTEFKDRMCACKDKACIDKLNDEMTKWIQEQARSADKGSEEDTRRMMAVSQEMSKCLQKAFTETAAGAAGGGAAGGGAAGGGAGGGAAGGGAAAGSDGSAGGGGAAAGSDTAGGGAGSAPPPAGSGDGSAGSGK